MSEYFNVLMCSFEKCIYQLQKIGNLLNKKCTPCFLHWAFNPTKREQLPPF